MTSPQHPDRPSAIPWPPVLLAIIIAAALASDRWLVPLPVPFAELSAIAAMGWLLLAGGMAVMVWAALAFRSHNTTIRPDRAATTLITSGPYAFSRNPLYLGEAMALLGAALVFNRMSLALAAVAFVPAVTTLAIHPEERHLERQFADDYRSYAARVRRWL